MADLAHLKELRRILNLSRELRPKELAALPRLHRHACSTIARLESTGENPRVATEARRLVSNAQSLLYRGSYQSKGSLWSRTIRLFFVTSPRAVRAEWRLLALSAFFVYGLALVSWFAVSHDLDLAPSLLNPAAVENEIDQLRHTPEGEPFRGNFTFGWGESPTTAGWIMVHNMGVGVLFFAAALIPPVYLLLLAVNGLMLGTYTAVAGHWGQAGAISSILWCHGVLEIQALLLAGAGGLALVRAWVRPGPWSRRHAMHLESQRALALLAPMFPMLFVAGMIEGFVSPHAPREVRLAVAVGTGILLLAWALFSGRSQRESAALLEPGGQ